jgi:hypothetical protein
MATLDEVFAEAERNNRVCPLPQKWSELYELLPNRRRKGNGWEPALPLILAAWWDTPSMLKTLRLREHIVWASEQGCLDMVHAFRVDLDEQEWHHIGQ